jgi:uncharacterized protein DUF6062
MASVPLNYYDFLETFPQTGCAICSLCQHDVARYIDAHLYEYANTPQTHAAFRASRGLCAVHSAQLLEYGASVLSLAILHSHVLDELLKIAAAPAVIGSALARLLGGSANPLADKLEPVEDCIACQILEHSEKGHARALAEHIDDPRLQAAFRASSGLCLPHFRLTLRAAPDAAKLETLVSIQTALWAKLKAELDSFADKYDINHADQAMGAEADSWRRAIPLVAGQADILGLRRK